MLSEQAKELINEHEVIISPAVRLELQYLFEIQRITVESNEIISDLSDRIGLKICDKSFNTILHSAPYKIKFTNYVKYIKQYK